MDFNYVLENCHWLRKVSETEYDVILDHHALSSFRACEQYFVHDHVEGWQAKGTKMPWFFAIGILLHEVLEELYTMRQDNTFDLNTLAARGMILWDEHNMEYYAGDKGHKAIGGKPGFVGMIVQYASFYNSDTERFRIIAMEIPFGPGKEVSLGSFTTLSRWQNPQESANIIKVNCYLAGRIDFLMDDGHHIAPFDHKSAAYIDGDPNDKYDPQDGMTGYIFATKAIVEKNFPDLAKQRQLNRIWMNYLGVSYNTDLNKRFKRLPLDKTDWQLEEFRKRQLTTFRRIFEMCYFGQEPQWNTNICGNMFRRDCKYKYVHKRKDEQSMFLIMNEAFERKPIWNPDLSHQTITTGE